MSIPPRKPRPLVALDVPDVLALAPGHSPIVPTANSWRHSASQASHPSLARDNVPLVEAIACGLASVAVPWELRADEDRPAVELVLATDRYDVWVVHWQPGALLDVRPQHPASCAVAIVSGMLTEEPVAEPAPGSVAGSLVGPFRDHLRLDRGSSRFIAASSARKLVNSSGWMTTSVHVHSPPLLVPHPVPHVPPPTP